ncbi:MAG: protease inhibitor I42 family protein [Myxococcaceae bacterium]
MAKAKSGAKKPVEKKAKPATKAAALQKSAAKAVAKPAAPKPMSAPPKKVAALKKMAAPKGLPLAKGKAKGPVVKAAAKGIAVRSAPSVPAPDKPKPRATKLPVAGQPFTKREMEQILTVGQGRGVFGEGSLKGRLVVKDAFPYLHVIGRDKRELVFLLQGPDQEVLPNYAQYKVSVSGLIKKTHNYGGTVDVRKYSAKRADAEAPVEQAAVQKLQFLSPGEIEQLISPGMGAGMKGFARVRGSVEMSGDEFVLVVSNSGTRHQVSFMLDGKLVKSLRKHLGQTFLVTGVVEKTSGWGGKVAVEGFEPRASDFRMSGRDGIEMVQVEASGSASTVEVKANHGLTVRLPEKAGFHWAIEPTTAKRVGLREANFEPTSSGAAIREFFFTPRNPGSFAVEFFLAKAFNPAQVSKTHQLALTVKP